MALADAGIIMKDLVSSVAAGSIDGQVVVDMIYDEEAYDGVVADIPVAFISDKVSLLQMDGIVPKEVVKKAIEMAGKTCKKIYEVQKKALKDKFKVEGLK